MIFPQRILLMKNYPLSQYWGEAISRAFGLSTCYKKIKNICWISFNVLLIDLDILISRNKNGGFIFRHTFWTPVTINGFLDHLIQTSFFYKCRIISYLSYNRFSRSLPLRSCISIQAEDRRFSAVSLSRWSVTNRSSVSTKVCWEIRPFLPSKRFR